MTTSREVEGHIPSGQNIAQQLIAAGENLTGIGPVPVAKDGMSKTQKEELNDRLRAERFGISGAMLGEFARVVLVPASESGRPTFNFPIVPRPREARASRKKVLFTYTMLQDREALGVQFGDRLPDRPGIYVIWQPYPNATVFDDMQGDIRTALDDQHIAWAEDQEMGDTKVWKWAQRLVEVSQQQKALGVREAILTEIDGEERNLEMTGGTVAASTPMEAIERLPIENIVKVHGELVKVALGLLDRNGMINEATRLQVLDDIALQTYSISRHHIARFANGEATDVSDASRIMKLNPSLHQNQQGRWSLDWAGRVKPVPKDKIFSRTERCSAGYELVEGEPSALHRLSWAFNTEIKNRGLLVPDAAKQPAPKIKLPNPIRVSSTR